MTRSRWFALSTAALVAACGSSPPPAQPDAAPAAQVTLEVSSKWVAFAQDGGAWQQLTPDASGRYSVPRPAGPYMFVYECQTYQTHSIKVIQAGPGDVRDWGDVCMYAPTTAPLDVRPSIGTNVLAQRASWYARPDNVAPVPVPTGVHDIGLIIDTDTPLISLVRDLAVDGPTQISPKYEDYTSMVPGEVDVGDTTVLSAADVTIGHHTWIQLQWLPKRWWIPSSLLRPGDVQRQRIMTGLEGAGQWAEIDRGPGRDPGKVAVTLAGAITEAAVSIAPRPEITFTAPGTWNELRGEIWGAPAPDGPERWVLEAHPGWLASHPVDGVVQFPDLASIPGWSPTWALTQASDWGVRVGEHAQDGVIRGAQFYAPCSQYRCQIPQ